MAAAPGTGQFGVDDALWLWDETYASCAGDRCCMDADSAERRCARGADRSTTRSLLRVTSDPVVLRSGANATIGDAIRVFVLANRDIVDLSLDQAKQSCPVS